jgi:7-keto-8-aminopelargonate synthetase and related enzymes
VHGVGLYGKVVQDIRAGGQQHSIDIVNGTLSKAVGVFGGYIAHRQQVIDFIRSFGSGFIFTTSLPPAICAAANKKYSIHSAERSVKKTFF